MDMLRRTRLRWLLLALLLLPLGSVASASGGDGDGDAEGAGAEKSFAEELPMLVASCVLAGVLASQAVYYDDDGDPTGVRPRLTLPQCSSLQLTCAQTTTAVG
jgi:hypothetical protein